MNNQDFQKEIIELIEKAKAIDPKYNYSWFARKLGRTPQSLSYDLNTASKFDIELYTDIKSICVKEGIISPPSRAWKKLNREVREIETSLFHQFELLNLVTDKVGDDEEFNDAERPEVLAVLKGLQNSMNNKIEKMIQELGSR